VIAGVAALEPDGVALLTFDCAPWLDAMKMLDYMPPALLSCNCLPFDQPPPPHRNDGGKGGGNHDGNNRNGDDDAENGRENRYHDRNFVSIPAQWDPRLDGMEFSDLPSDPWAHYPPLHESNAGGEKKVRVSSSMHYARHWQKAYNTTSLPGYLFASFSACLSMLEAAVTLANTTAGPRVNQQLHGLSQPSWYGRLETNAYGFNHHRPILILQQDEKGKSQIIGQ
jgi:hypothetical protein